jgi:hypothetical protein
MNNGHNHNNGNNNNNRYNNNNNSHYNNKNSKFSSNQFSTRQVVELNMTKLFSNFTHMLGLINAIKFNKLAFK